MEDVELLPSPQPKQQFKWKWHTYFLIAVGILVFISVITLFSTSSDAVVKSPVSQPLMSKYIVHSGLWTPSSSIKEEIATSVSSLVSLLEGVYRKAGIENSYIESNKFLRLSRKSLQDKILSVCKGSSNILCKKIIKDEALVSLSPEVLLRLLSTYPQLLKSVQTVADCKENSSSLCQTPKNNVLSFKVKEKSMTTDLNTLKRMLQTTQKPVMIAVPKPVHNYDIDCSTSEDGFCKGKGDDIIRISLELPGTRTSFFKSPDITMGSLETYLVYGYDDRYLSQKVFLDTFKPGALIVRTPDDLGGRSLSYFLGNISSVQDSQICPSDEDIATWTPVTLDCMNEHANPSLCSLDIEFKSGKTYFKGGRTLECINPDHCDENMLYVLERLPGTNDLSCVYDNKGNRYAKVISFTENTQPAPFLVETIPVQHLNLIFKPAVPSYSPPSSCNFIAIPYEYLDITKSLSSPRLPSWSAYQVDIEWDKGSYGRTSNSKTYKSVIESMSDAEIPSAEDPLSSIL